MTNEETRKKIGCYLVYNTATNAVNGNLDFTHIRFANREEVIKAAKEVLADEDNNADVWSSWFSEMIVFDDGSIELNYLGIDELEE